MTHQKKLSAPNHYPVTEQEQKYVSTTEGSRSTETSVPAVLFLRDVVEYADTKKEAKNIVRNGDLLRNGEPVKDIREGLGELDVVELPPAEESYRVMRNAGRMEFVRTENTETVAKITGKDEQGERLLYRLHNGENYSTRDDFQTGNTLIFDEGVQEIELEEGAEVIIRKGSHAGDRATVKEVTERGMNPDTALVEADEEFETQLENLVAVTGTELE